MPSKEKQTIYDTQEQIIDALQVSRPPIFIWLAIVYISAMILQNVTEPVLVGSITFSLFFIGHALMHWISYRFIRNRAWGYFLIQGILAFVCASCLSSGYPAVLFGMLPILVGQSIAFFDRKRYVFLVFTAANLLFFYTLHFMTGNHLLTLLIPLFTFTLILVVAYGYLFYQQVQARLRTQRFLQDLEAAHRQVEELTLANERQRMARDLHDTLAQGVAGLIMKLEAVDAFLSQGKTSRAHEVVRMSTQQARVTLADARKVIDNLRLQGSLDIGLEEAVTDEVERFRNATGISVSLRIDVNNPTSRKLHEHCLRIISECLTNAARHSKASQVWIEVVRRGTELDIEVRDNGEGFNPELIGRQSGHYGLLGIQERARLLNGQVGIKSGNEGTSVRLTVPLTQGETYEST